MDRRGAARPAGGGAGDTWNYRSQDAAIRHIGPVAQDFYAAFGVGEDDRHISTIDADGVALAAIQGLYQVVQQKETRIADLGSAAAGARGGRMRRWTRA